MGNVISLDDMFCELGGVQITGFGENAIDIPSPDSVISSKKGLDTVAWLRQNMKSIELLITISLLADSPSVKVLKGFEKTGAVVPFRFEWEELGIYIEALDAVVVETGGLKVGTEMPELGFEVRVKNFAEIKGL